MIGKQRRKIRSTELSLRGAKAFTLTYVRRCFTFNDRDRSQKCAIYSFLVLYTIYAVFRSTVEWSVRVGQEKFKGGSPKITESPL